MKTTLLLIVMMTMVCWGSAQPVMQNANLPAVGFSVPLSFATSSYSGGAGANQTWDFSTLTFTPGGTVTVLNAATSTYGASYPSANYACKISGMGADQYIYQDFGTSVLEEYAALITSPGSGNDYTPNPKSLAKFPFNYGDSLQDTYQKVGDTPNNVTLTYDGYGTLITSTGTYTNVVRIRADYGGSNYDYYWWTLNPLMYLVVYDADINLFYYVGTAPTQVTEDAPLHPVVYPNPVVEGHPLEVSGLPGGFEGDFVLINTLGQQVTRKAVRGSSFSIQVDGVPAGVYVYQLQDQRGRAYSSRIVIE